MRRSRAELGELSLAADFSDQPARLVRRLETAWAQNRAVSVARRPSQRRHLEFAALFARLGDTTRARQLLAGTSCLHSAMAQIVRLTRKN